MASSNRQVLSVFLTHLRRYSGRVFLVFLSIAVATGIESIIPWYERDIFNILGQTTPSLTAFYSLIGILLIIVTLRLFSWLGWRISGFITTDFQPRVMSDLQQTCFNYMLGHSYQFFTNNFSGSLVRKVGRISRAFERICDEVQFRLLPLAVVLIGATIGLFLRFPVVAVIFLIWTAVFIYSNYLSSMWKLKIDVKRAAVDSESTGLLADSLTNSITIKLFSGMKFEIDLYHKVMEKWRKLQTQGWTRGEIIFAFQGLLVIGVEVGLLYFGLKMWSQGLIMIGDLILIQSYLGIVLSRLWDIGRCFRNIFEGFADAREMVEILELPYEVKEDLDAKKLKVSAGALEFKQVDFCFNQTRKILTDFNLQIAPGKKIALVGSSGAGKTTITKLLFRFYDLTAGEIKIDGQNIAKVTQESLRSQISLVPQEPVLFHRSLMENIRYGRRDATDAEVIAAAKKASCHEFIANLSEGYNTYVGERGVKLSGGERQRVAIARAILKNAPILVLDEATSSLDSESEQLIQKALRELMKDKTTIVIAHRLSTIMLMDEIVVIDNGTIVDRGSHDELLKKNGVYKKLWEIQAGGFIA